VIRPLVRNPAAAVTVRLVTIMLALIVTACATTTTPVPAPSADTAWQARQRRLATLQRWTLQGRVAIETAQDSGTATLTWEQDGDRYIMRIMAPLSQGTFELRGDDRSVALRTPENETLTATDPQALMQQNLGWSLPVAGLKYWVRGIPAPGSPARQLRVDAAGRMLDLEQDGWRVSVLRYKLVGTEEVPDKLYMENSPLKMRVVIAEWKFQL